MPSSACPSCESDIVLADRACALCFCGAHSMTVRLAVAGAFHTDYMQPAVDKLKAALDATEIK